MKKNKFVVSKILKFLDKKIILPITKVFVWIFEKIDKKGLGLEKLLSKKSTLILISLILSLVLFFIVDIKSLILLESSADVIYNQKVNAIFNEEAYVIEGLPEYVDITLIGRKSDLYLAKQLPSHEVSIDLKTLKPGTHRVSLRYRGAIDTINYKLDPSVASITIYPKVSEVRTLTVDVLNKDNLDPKLSISNVELDKQEVIIKGAEHVLKEVSSVKALVDINNMTSYEEGINLLNDIPLIAYDQKGFIIDVEMVPSTLSASITIESPNKTVPIKLVPTGELAFGKSIKEMVSDISTVTIYGEKQAIEKIMEVEIEVDVEKISEDKSITAMIRRPNGVRYLSVTSTVVNIKIGEEKTIELNNIPIEYKNLSNNLVVTMASKEDTLIPVIIRGYEDVIDKITATDIKAFVDLAGYKEGTYEVDVLIEGTDLRAIYIPKTKKVNLIIGVKK